MKRWYGSLHARLMISLGSGWVLLVVALLGSSWYLGRDITRETLFTHMEYQAELIARDIEQDVEKRLQALSGLRGQIDAPLPPAPEASLQQLLTYNTGLLAYFDALVVINRDGTLVGEWPTEGRLGLNVAQREYFQHLLHTRRSYVSEPFTGLVTNEPLVMFAVPLVDDELQFQGMVGGMVRVLGDNFLGRLQRLRLGQEGFAGLGTASGTILVHRNPELILRPLPGAEVNPWIALATLGWEGAAEGQMLDGTQALQAYRQLWLPDWIVGVYLPEQEAYAAFDRLWWILWLIGGGVLLISLPTLWLFLQMLLQPVRRFAIQIDAITRGEQERLKANTPLSELRSVATRFNALLRSLERNRNDLVRRQAYLDAVLDSSPSGIALSDLIGDVIYVNQALQSMTGYAAESLRGKRWQESIHPDDRDALLESRLQAIAHHRSFENQYRCIRADGQQIWLESHASPIKNEAGQYQGYINTFRDITERKNQEEKHRWAALHDGLTHLLNRRGFDQVMDAALQRWQEHQQQSALLLIDLDHFKPVNDNLGHDMGDLWLQGIADILRQQAGQQGTPARQGGDEFALLLKDCDKHQAEVIAESIRQAVEQLVISGSEQYRVTTSIGISDFLPDDSHVTALIKRADEACYAAKAAGRNCIILAD
ncbi:sensor domain-containing diguanylate cyclase [Marinospirillum alkaliphilum]|uniref:PAS domain S-box-containing protein/diguanylate cyclase (GGDEF) domain-containing protein n=1 Tax=Marinospirillum alkaliphilum DSM 21637 TaxID=1122209 RepID=A0A1K1VK57_9GAMM|nr:diguanylate cyclase [Marinospirillum alkaliphilum]SFX25542.1 PAS domain S-box-containing protein/diguanylate cyclase (GGDEF) domain-containing protein [Marinospirillum alkaliphilum DSM 21637]